jgi:hypothetical protein
MNQATQGTDCGQRPLDAGFMVAVHHGRDLILSRVPVLNAGSVIGLVRSALDWIIA